MYPSQPLEVEVESLDGRRVIRACGEIDMSSIEPLRTAVAAAEASRLETLVDLSGVDFIDSTGLHLILEASLEAASNGWPLTFVPSRQVLRLLEVSGTLEVVPLAAPASGN
jgi:anti-anti-sigma factor